MSQAQQTRSDPQPGDDEVAAYLAEHTDFFADRPELLAALDLQHPSGRAVSLIERQVGALREQKERAERKLAELVEMAHENDRLGEKLHDLALSLLDHGTLDTTVASIHDHLRRSFAADATALLLFDDQVSGPAPDGVRWLASDRPELAEFDNILGGSAPICGRLTGRQLEALFGEAAPGIGSAVVVPLAADTAFGLLAIGSTDPDRYQHGMGTAFLVLLGRLVGRALQRDLQLTDVARTGE